MMRLLRLTLLSALSFSGLAACGGGSSGGSSSEPLPPPPPPQPPALSTNADLGSLSVSATTLDQLFSSNLTTYTGSVGFLSTSTTVVASTADPDASLSINGVAAVSSAESAAIALEQGVNTIPVVVTAEDGVTKKAYSIDITRENTAEFAQTAYIKSSNMEAEDHFGWSIALDGDTMAVGAYGEDSAATGIAGDQADNSLSRPGAVYVFARNASGTWEQQAYIKASNTGAEDYFGKVLDLDGDTLVVAADNEQSAATGINGNQLDNSASGSGAVYVFTRNAQGAWSQQAYLKASNAESGDVFGWSIDLDNDTLVVGARREASMATGVNGDQADNSAKATEPRNESGAVYVYVRDQGGTWSQQAYIKSSNNDGNDRFGFSVAVAGDTLAAGAMYESGGSSGVNGDQSDNSVERSGAVYVFTRDATGNWAQQAYIKASNPDVQDYFGQAVALHGDYLAVGAFHENGADPGVNGDQQSNSLDGSGAVYLFSRDPQGNWSQEAYFKASNPGSFDFFGDTVLEIEEDILVVGAQAEDSLSSGVNDPQPDTGNNVQAGAVYVFTKDGAGTWREEAYIKASNTGATDFFGFAFALDGETLAVGAVGERSAATGIGGDQSDDSSPQAGAVYVFE